MLPHTFSHNPRSRISADLENWPPSSPNTFSDQLLITLEEPFSLLD